MTRTIVRAWLIALLTSYMVGSALLPRFLPIDVGRKLSHIPAEYWDN